VVAAEPGRADDAGLVGKLGQHDRHVPRGQRQRPGVDGAADLGEQRMPYAGDATADHDQPRVEKAHQASEHLPYPPAAVTDHADRDRVASRGRRRHVRCRQRSGARQQPG
jgi:hypothetical protein